MARTAVDRFTDPLYTRAEAARFLGITDTTLARRVKDTPFVTAVRAPHGTASLPFIGLAEAHQPLAQSPRSRALIGTIHWAGCGSTANHSDGRRSPHRCQGAAGQSVQRGEWIQAISEAELL